MNDVKFTLSLLVFVLSIGFSQLSAQNVVCHPSLTTTLDDNCKAVLTIDALTTNGCDDCDVTAELIKLGEHAVDLGDANVMMQGGPSVVVATPGTYRYVITPPDDSGITGCWGEFVVEDKSSPYCDPADDKEPDLIYCNSLVKLPDPSGYDDLAPEVVSCYVLEEFGAEGIEPWFDVLELFDEGDDTNGDGVVDSPRDVNRDGVIHYADFTDCSKLKDIFHSTTREEVCGFDMWADDAFTQSDDCDNWRCHLPRKQIPCGWEVCEVFKRSWWATDWSGMISDTCSQYVFVIRPKGHLIHLNMNSYTECTDTDRNGDLIIDDMMPYFYDAVPVNSTDIITCPGHEGEKIELQPNTHYCKYVASFHSDPPTYTCNKDDVEHPFGDGCEGNTSTYKQAFHWTIVDWCTGNKVCGNVWRRDGPKQQPYLMLGAEEISVRECPSRRRIRRRCVLFDEFTQIKEVYDDTAPVIPDAKFSFWEDPFDCTTSLYAEFNPTDVCAGVSHVELEAYYTYFDPKDHTNQSFDRVIVWENTLEMSDIPLNALVTIVYRVWDCCGNMTEVTKTGSAEDANGPVCIGNDELSIGLIQADHDDNHNGRIDADEHKVGARIYGEDLDDTSRDNCHPVIMEVRDGELYAAGSTDHNANWGPYVEYIWNTADFEAEYPDCKGAKWLQLKVTEDRNHNGQVDGDELYTVCDVGAIFADQTKPGVLVDCYEVFECTDHIEFDEPIFWGACTDVTYVIDTVDYHCATNVLNHCTADRFDRINNVIRTITKTWTATKAVWHGTLTTVESQTLFITDERDEEWWFPYDVKFVCTDDIQVPDHLGLSDFLNNDGCQQWVVHSVDDTYVGDDEACYKIVRNYTFANWCLVDETVLAAPAPALQKTNLFHDYTNCNPTNSRQVYDLNGDGKLIEGEDNNVHHPNLINCGTAANPDIHDLNENSDIWQHINDGYFSYIQIIKVTDFSNPVVEATVTPGCDDADPDCYGGTIDVIATTSDACGDSQVEEIKIVRKSDGKDVIRSDVEGSYTTDVDAGTASATNLDKGTYTVLIAADDDCGNRTWYEEDVVVWNDCKKPTPVATLPIVPVMESGSITVWMSDLVLDSYDNCAVVSDGITRIQDETTVTDNVTFDCSDLGSAAFYYYVFDAEGNYQFVEIIINVQDNGGFCGGHSVAVGNITNEEGEDISDVMVNVESVNPFAQIFEPGFHFSVPMLTDVTITPEKDINYGNGVSTSDLVVAQRHILGIAPLTSAYQFIAADASGDDAVDTRDILHISRMILGITDQFPNVPSWRFVDASHTFDNPTEPWGFPEAVDYFNLAADVQANFIGVKIGDISGNARPNQLVGDNEVVRGTMVVAISDKQLAAGQTHTIDFTAEDFDAYTGYQFTIQLADGVNFNSVTPGSLPGMTASNFGLTLLDEGLVTTSYANGEAISLEDGAVLFSLTVTANVTVNLADVISINSAYTAAEAYNDDLDVFDVTAAFNVETSSFELYQNQPNPFNIESKIGFSLPEASAATFRVFDISGRTLKTIEGDFVKGYNEVTINKADLGAAGVLYYQLDTKNDSATKKMIIIE